MFRVWASKACYDLQRAARMGALVVLHLLPARRTRGMPLDLRQLEVSEGRSFAACQDVDLKRDWRWSLPVN